MKLSDAYLEKTDSPMLELSVKVININLQAQHKLLAQCRPMYEYSWLIERIRKYMLLGQNRDEAITSAIKDCEKEGIMVDFVREHGSEAVNMIFTQWNFEDALEVRYEEGLEDGETVCLIKQVCCKLQKGKATGVIAEELEAELSIVERICQAVQVSGTNADIDRIYKEFQKLS